MRRKVITKRTREQAALISSMCANDPEGCVVDAAASLGLDQLSVAVELADEAWRHVLRTSGQGDIAKHNARAESLLRTGFTPEGWSP